MMADAVLRASGVYAGYGRGDIIHGVSVEARPGEIVTVIGPNGAGKSTLIKTIAGLLSPRPGTVAIGDEEIGGLPAPAVARRGIAFVPQEANVFRQLTVAENLEMGAWTDQDRKDERLDKVHALFRFWRSAAMCGPGTSLAVSARCRFRHGHDGGAARPSSR